MNAQDWKLSVTGDNCPKWCTEGHTHEDPEWDSIIHESSPLTVPLPPRYDGKLLRLAFTTACAESYQSRAEGRRTTYIEFNVQEEVGGASEGCAPVATVEELDKVIHDLRQASATLEQWRDRLAASVA